MRPTLPTWVAAGTGPSEHWVFLQAPLQVGALR